MFKRATDRPFLLILLIFSLSLALALASWTLMSADRMHQRHKVFAFEVSGHQFIVFPTGYDFIEVSGVPG